MKNDYSTSHRRYGNEMIANGRGGEDDEEDGGDNLEENLMLKTSRLKHITISLGNEIRGSNKLIDELDSDFDKSKNFIDYAMRGVGRLSRSGSCKLYLYLFLFSCFVFFCLYIIIKWF